jgi:hypothetical protein
MERDGSLGSVRSERGLSHRSRGSFVIAWPGNLPGDYPSARRQDRDLMRRGRHSGERKRGGGRPLLSIGGSQHHELVWRNRKARDLIARQFCGRGPDSANHEGCSGRNNKGIFVGIGGSMLNDQPLPLHVMEEKDRKLVERAYLFQPAAFYEGPALVPEQIYLWHESQPGMAGTARLGTNRLTRTGADPF